MTDDAATEENRFSLPDFKPVFECRAADLKQEAERTGVN